VRVSGQVGSAAWSLGLGAGNYSESPGVLVSVRAYGSYPSGCERYAIEMPIWRFWWRRRVRQWGEFVSSG
jgi:hypothetical protein